MSCMSEQPSEYTQDPIKKAIDELKEKGILEEAKRMTDEGRVLKENSGMGGAGSVSPTGERTETYEWTDESDKIFRPPTRFK